MLESMSKKNFFTSLTMKKVHIKSAPKKVKKYVTKQIKNIKQTPTLSPINLREKNKNNIDDIKYAEPPLHGVLKGNNLTQVGLERNEYRIIVIKRTEWPPLMEAITIPNEIEENFYSLLKNNKVDNKSIDLIKETIREMKKTKSSDDVVIKIYDFYELFIDKEYVTNEFIVSYLKEPMEIAKNTECIDLKPLPPLPKETIKIPEPIDVANQLYNKLTETISKMSRIKDVPDKLFIHFRENVLSLKREEKPEVFIKKLNELYEYAFEILPQATLNRIESNLGDYIKIKTAIVKPVRIFDDLKKKPKSLRERLLNTIECKLFFLIKKIKKAYLEVKKIFCF
nr:hypothetical protein [Providencia rettgeri]